MSDDERSGERAQGRVGEDVADEPVVLNDRYLLIVESSHSGGFLPAVLERIQRVVTKVCDASSRSNYPNDAASFFHAFSTVGVRN